MFMVDMHAPFDGQDVTSMKVLNHMFTG